MLQTCPEKKVNHSPLEDTFGRKIKYLRVSVTDRCDFRCVYCMSENMTFLPKPELLTFEELDQLCTTFIEMGVEKIRLTGGEPLVRKGIMGFINAISRHLGTKALKELTLTTNGSQLPKFSTDLVKAGIKRINISLDTLDPEKFKKLTRWGNLEKVLAGIDSALDAGLKVKINAVAVKGVNEFELDDMISWCGSKSMDLTLIETMPMGKIDFKRSDQYLSLEKVKSDLSKNWTLIPSDHNSGGPARYFDISETGQKLGLITPMTQNFCEGCNRVRLTCTGQLYMCLGQSNKMDLRSALRSLDPDQNTTDAIREAIFQKPKGHEFVIDKNDPSPSIERHMNVTGG